MFQRILVPTDGSEITGRAVAVAIGLAKSLGAEIFTLCVKEPFPYGAVAEMQPTPPQEFFDAQERTATRNVQAVAQACEAAGIACHAQTVEGVQPWEAIVAHASEQRCAHASPSRAGRSAARRRGRRLPPTAASPRPSAPGRRCRPPRRPRPRRAHAALPFALAHRRIPGAASAASRQRRRTGRAP